MNCPKCGSEMKLRKGRNGDSFWGCSKYPDCRGTRPAEGEQAVRQHTQTQKPQKPNNGNGRDPKWTLLNTCILTAKDLCNADPDQVMPLANTYYNEAIDIITGKYQSKQVADAFEGEQVDPAI